MSTTTSGATIFYTKDGTTTPTHTGNTAGTNTFVYGGAVNVAAGTEKIFQALAYKSGYADSAVDEFDADNRGGGMAPMSASTTTTIFSVWDGDWAILEEYDSSGNLVEKYLQGYHGLVKTFQTVAYYYQDELGSTSHIAAASGALLEYYKYDLYGKPTFFSSTSQPLNSSTYGVKDLFTGQRWIPELGLYDDRNRFMSPDLGRFLQPDPIGFKGDSSNLYRYCGNDWANKTDPMGTNPGDPFNSAAAAGADAVRFINPTSIKQNLEYGGLMYKQNGKYYATSATNDASGTSFDPHSVNIPRNAQLVGDYHTHGAYSTENPITKQPMATNDPKKDSYNSDHFSQPDITGIHADGAGKPEYAGVLGTPSGKIRALDGTDPASSEKTIKDVGRGNARFRTPAAVGVNGSQPAPIYTGGALGGGTAWGEQTDGSFVDSQGSNMNLGGDGGSCNSVPLWISRQLP